MIYEVKIGLHWLLVVDFEIPSVNELDELCSYHSFRHTFISNIRNNHSFDLSLIQQVVGHEISKR